MQSREAGQVGAYRIVRHWASGDTSQVYLARRGESATLVALKTPSAERAHDREHAKRFAREGMIAERADHEHVVQTLQAFEHEGEPYLAMEFLHGETLHDVLRAIHPHRRMPAALALEITHRLARALHYLHQIGANHGDVCPANVILTYDGRVKLIDLGGRCEGSNAYASPEQARGESIDARADVFSLGLILFELLTGRRVRQGWGDNEIIASAISGSVPRLSDLVESDPELDALVMTAVAHDRAARYPDAERFAEALLAYRDRVVPGLALESKLADFMEHNFSGRARALGAYLSGARPRLSQEPLLASIPPLGHSDPTALIEAALRAPEVRPSPFFEPITSDSWSSDRTNQSHDLGPIPRRPYWPLAIGLLLLLSAALIGWMLGASS